MIDARETQAAHGAPATAQEALGRARDHARRALAEALLAARSLLDAAALGISGQPAERVPALARLVGLLEQTSRGLADDTSRLAGPIVESILDALDHEVRRWELRARDDAEARAVLRAFLGVREILWEFGLRREGEAAPTDRERPEAGGARGTSREGRTRRRVQRVRVQG